MITDSMITILNKLFKTEITGLEKLDFSKPTILMPNHTSLADVAFLAGLLPPNVYFVSNTKNAKKYASIIKGRNVITVDPLNPYSLRSVLRVIKQGHPVVIFPEGRITRTGGLMKVYQGVGFIAMKTNATVYPIAIHGLDRSKFSYIKELQRTKFFPKVKVAIGDPFTLEKKEQISMRKQKEQNADRILEMLQSGRFQMEKKEEVNLFNEVLLAGKRNGYSTFISEDINGRARYKDLLLNSYVLSRKFNELLKFDTNVGVLMPNTNAHVVILLSLFKIGKTPAILNFSVGKQAIQDNVETAQLKTVITSKQFIQSGKLDHLIDALKEKDVRILYLDKEDGETTLKVFANNLEINEEITALDKLHGLKEFTMKKEAETTNNHLMLFTSGSESKPKGVLLSHANIHANIYQANSVIDVTSKDRMLNALPMFHSFGLTAGTFLPILLGIEVFLYPNPLHYRAIPEIAYNRRSTILFGTSTFLAGYGKHAHPYDFFKMRIVIAGGEKLNTEVIDLWAEKFGIRLLEGYGVTEASPVIALNTPLFYKRGTVGKLFPHIAYKIEPVEGIEKGGNLLVKGPNIASSYYIHEKGIVPIDEWYNTGDIVEIDEKGFVRIVGRLKRFAKIGGEMISLNVVEQIAAACFKEGSFAAISIPDKRKGEQIVLFTTNEEAKKDALREYLLQNGYSGLLVPLQFIIKKELPLLGSGKLDYVTLNKELSSAKKETL